MERRGRENQNASGDLEQLLVRWCAYLKQTSPVSLMFGCHSRVLHTT